MKIDERKALNTQKPQSEKVYETKAEVASRTAQKSSQAREDGVALQGQDQLRVLAMTPSAVDTSRVERLTQLVQSGQYQVDPLALSGAMVAAMLKGYEQGLDMTLKERCQAGEAKLEQVSTALLDPRPESLDRCEGELQEVIALLESPADRSADKLADQRALLRLRNRIRLLALQAQQATNLCQGWAQLGLSEGYTDQGKPALPPGEPRTSYEV